MKKKKEISVPEKPSFVTSQFGSLLKKSKMYIIKTSEDVQTPDDIKALLRKAKSIKLNEESSEEEYDHAKKIWREVKDCHISLRNNTDSLKEPINKFKKDIDAFSDKIYQPLKKAEQYVKENMAVFEKNIKLNKKEFKERQKKKEEQQQRISELLTRLNNNKTLINESTKKSHIITIENRLKSINFNDFGESSSEASFIVQNLLNLCKEKIKTLPETEESVKKEPADKVKNEKLDDKLGVNNKSQVNKVQTIDFKDNYFEKSFEKSENKTTLKPQKKSEENNVEDLTDGGEVTFDDKKKSETSSEKERIENLEENKEDETETKKDNDSKQVEEKDIPKIYKNQNGDKFFAIEYVNESVKLSYENFLTIRDEKTEEVTDLFTVAYREFEEDCRLPSKIQVTFENSEGEREIATYKRE